MPFIATANIEAEVKMRWKSKGFLLGVVTLEMRVGHTFQCQSSAGCVSSELRTERRARAVGLAGIVGSCGVM